MFTVLETLVGTVVGMKVETVYWSGTVNWLCSSLHDNGLTLCYSGGHVYARA